MISNSESGTRIDEIAERIYRISTPIPPDVIPGGFTFNQFLIEDEEPLLFHTGMRSLFPLVSEAIATVMPIERLRYLAFSHVEADECGALSDFLRLAPQARPVCSRVAAEISLADTAAVEPLGMVDGAVLKLGRRELTWLDAAHVPHNWETGYLFEPASGTLFCGDLFVQGGDRLPALTEADILEPAEAFRAADEDSQLPPAWSYSPSTRAALERFAGLAPRTLACMHGSSWRGRGEQGALMLRELAVRLEDSIRRQRP
jgi:flavorubredoxin